jgi:hypothetical protein
MLGLPGKYECLGASKNLHILHTDITAERSRGLAEHAVSLQSKTMPFTLGYHIIQAFPRWLELR